MRVNPTRLAVTFILGSVILSGPLVPVVDLTAPKADSPDDSGVGNATITVVEPPASDFRIAPARFGAGTYLYSQPVTVQVASVTGHPTLTYEIRIPGLGFNVVTLAFLSEDEAGRNLDLSIARSSIRPEQVTEPSYPAELELRLRSGNQSRVVWRQNVTVNVEGTDGG